MTNLGKTVTFPDHLPRSSSDPSQVPPSAQFGSHLASILEGFGSILGAKWGHKCTQAPPNPLLTPSCFDHFWLCFRPLWGTSHLSVHPIVCLGLAGFPKGLQFNQIEVRGGQNAPQRVQNGAPGGPWGDLLGDLGGPWGLLGHPWGPLGVQGVFFIPILDHFGHP